MAMNLTLVRIARFCFVLHMVFYGAHALPQAETSKLGRAVEVELQINPLSGAYNKEERLGEREECSGLNQYCARVICCPGMTCTRSAIIGYKICKRD